VRIAVTGASGFIGRTLGTALHADGHDLVPLKLRGADGLRALRGADALVHLAAIAHRRASGEELQRVNVDLAAQSGRAAAALGIPMLFISSVKVHGEESATPLREASPFAPQDAYGASKARAEELLRAVPGLRLTVLRPPLVYGPAVKANFLALMTAVARGLPLPLASVTNRRSLVYIGNLADAILSCLARSGAAGGTYLVSDGLALSTAEICRRLGRELGRPARLFRFPVKLLEALPGGRAMTRSLEVDDAAIRRELGWQPPYSVEEGLRATAAWYRGR
jgi:UDP-N-acetyl-alpha-D-quinovosamine dehydrogenase